MINKLRLIGKMAKKRISKPELSRFPCLPYPTVDLVYWRGKDFVNFGDECGRTVVELMLARKGITIFDEVKATRRMIAVGSGLHYAENDTVIWGTGRNGSHPDWEHQFKRIDVRAVRGPRTREFLMSRGIEVPEVYGDPALLLPILTSGRFQRTGEFDCAFVPNLNDYDESPNYPQIRLPILDPRRSWNRTVAEILQHKFIMASSLHAIIIAEAFGIPARYVRLREHEGLFKYHDYYEGTGRILGEYALSIDQGLEMGGKELPEFDPVRLINAFPYDIWG
jgi:pyruvyltransferase